MQREGGAPGAARAADELETVRRIRRVSVSETDANPYRRPQTGMVAVGRRDWYEEVPVAEDDEPDPVDSAGVPSGYDARDATEAGTDAPAAPAADTDDDGDGSDLQDFHRRLDALSPSKSPRLAAPSAIAGAARPPAAVSTAWPPA